MPPPTYQYGPPMASGAPGPAPSQQRDPHLEALADAIMQQLQGPAPTAPTPPAFTGLSPLAAAAGAMNPQQIPTLIQKQMGPAQAQFAQQQAAFEQAMQGRRDALTAGTSILNTGTRAGAYANRPTSAQRAKIDEFTRDIGGQSYRIRQVLDPMTGEVLDETNLGLAGYAPYIQPAIPGVSGPERIPRQGSAGPTGGNIPPAPPGTAKDATTALNMRVLYKDALSSYEGYLGRSGRAQRATTSMARKVPIVGGAIEENVLSYTDPEGIDVSRKIDNLADILLRLRSGAQINENEYGRLRSLLPKLGENPTTALANFRRFETELLTILRAARYRAPAMFTPDLMADLGLTEADLGGPVTQGQQKSRAEMLADEMGFK